MTKKPSARFAEWLDSFLVDARPGERLPTDKQLAATWGISHRTVSRVLTRYRNEGRVERIPGKGTFVAGDTDAPAKAAPAPPLSSADTIVAYVYRSICSGEFKQGEELPTVKFMRMYFRVSASTVVAAYRKLQELGHITKVGRTFWIASRASPLRPSSKKEVYLLADEPVHLKNLFHENMLAFSYQKCLRLLSDHGYMLLSDRIDSLSSLADQWSRTDRPPHGLIFCNMVVQDFDAMTARLQRLRGRLRGAVIPTVVDFEGGLAPRIKDTFFVSRAHMSTLVSRALVRLMAEGDYSRAAFFLDNTVPYDPWKGHLWPFWSAVKMRTELKHLQPGVHFRFVVECRRDPGSVDVYLARLSGHITEANQHGILNKYTPTSRDVLRDEISLVKKGCIAFDAFSDADIWVFSTQERAAQALAWARMHRVAVPKKLSIVSLEDDPSYYHLGMTYCTIDWETVGYLMAHAILGDIPIERTSKGFIRVRAQVVERLTTR